jgi:hypothetical protein
MSIRISRTAAGAAAVAALLFLAGPARGTRASAQVRPAPPNEKLPTIQPVYDGWYKNPDGTLSFSYGYINRSDKAIEIPAGVNNTFIPAPASRGQTTVFQPGTERYTFVVTLPGDFQQNLVWAVTYNGLTAKTTERGGLNPLYMISDVPPKATPDNAPARPEMGPPRRVKVGEATKLRVTVQTNTVPGAKVTYAWAKRSGPGPGDDVKFDPPDAQQTSATFAAPGEYLVRFTVSRPSGMDTIRGTADFKIVVQ